MPTYEYFCENCNLLDEKQHSIKENPTFNCPSCDGEMSRVIASNTSFILKGQGWARDGYGNKK